MGPPKSIQNAVQPAKTARQPVADRAYEIFCGRLEVFAGVPCAAWDNAEGVWQCHRCLVTLRLVTEERQRWVPDDQLIPSVLAGSGRKMSQLGSSDRSWVVAGLTLAGLTAEDIADRMDCSLRLVRSIRAEDMTRVCSMMQSESRAFSDELRLVRSEAVGLQRRMSAMDQELGRAREKLGRLLDARLGVKRCGKCDSSMSGYNLYVHNGKDFCRECHRRRQQQYRDARSFVQVLPRVVVFSSQ
jgi:hypothetical protein